MKTILRNTLLSILIAWSAAPAQSLSASSSKQVKAEVKLSQETFQSGSSAQVAILLTIEEGWHINAHTPTYDYLIGTSVELQTIEGVIIADIRYPEGTLQQFGFADDLLRVYDETVPIFLTLKLSDKIKPGTHTLPATVKIQACNDQVCLAPSSLSVDVLLIVAAAGESVQKKNESLFARYDEALLAGTENELAKLFATEGSFVAFLAIFLIGLALNLTPCVYPMLSVTVSLFGTQSDTNTARVFIKAVVYILGIASMYSVLGVTAAMSGGLFGSWLQSPWVLAAIGALLFALALSMFGVYQIQAPYWLTSKLGGATGTGFISLFISGLVVGVFAAPCIGPPVIALLALVGQKGDPVFGFWAFFVLSLGLGFPYLILGTFSGLLKKVPRSGAWLIWVERIFGVVLTGAALFYLSLAFLPRFAAYVVPFTLIAGGLYLGFIEPSAKDKVWLKRVKWVFGIACVVVGGVFANALREPSISWHPYNEDWINEAKASEQPIIIDFYADWCIPCLELDRKTFTNPDVIAVAERFVRLKVDLTHFDSPEAEALRKKFDIAGVPTIVFLDTNGEEALSSRVVGYLPPDRFLEKMKPLLPPTP
ncbi:MAG TPA: cytochrome c biogenesis protein CcdA [Bacteroidota bacterium]|nr:cytochrome c biogenesis protein CcdA [Bacteroidota bacterium]